jgi:hypothetical protein
MGLLDILSGMQNSPRGQRQPGPGNSSGGMSPMMMARPRRGSGQHSIRRVRGAWLPVPWGPFRSCSFRGPALSAKAAS